MISTPDEDKLKFNFWRLHRAHAPETFTHESPRTWYSFTTGYHPSKLGPVVSQALMNVWAEGWGKLDVDEYLKYMSFMPHNLSEFFKDLTPVLSVVGDCTFENIVVGKRVVFIDPGYARGLYCKENDLAKTLQSARGWDARKRNQPYTPASFDDYAPEIVAIYVTHLYRLLRHKHPGYMLAWAREEADLALKHLHH